MFHKLLSIIVIENKKKIKFLIFKYKQNLNPFILFNEIILKCFF